MGEEHLQEIGDHIERHLGKVASVFHEIISDVVHVDIHLVAPTPDFPCYRLITSGMSDLPMKVPADSQQSPYLELMVPLPGDWKLTTEDFKDENWYWPVRALKVLARLPHLNDTWLGFGHTIPNGEPYASGTKLDGAIILPPISSPGEFYKLDLPDGKSILFLAVVPLYPEEMALKLA